MLLRAFWIWISLASGSSLRTTTLPLVRDLSLAYESRMILRAQIGTPPTIYRMQLTANSTAPIDIFHCVQKLSSTFGDADTIRFTQHAFVSDRRSMLRVGLRQACNVSERAPPDVDGTISLRDSAAPLWRAYPLVTLGRNFVTLRTAAARADDGIVCNAKARLAHSYCEFDAVLGTRPVLVALAVDFAAVTLPAWASAPLIELSVGAQTIRVDVAQLASHDERMPNNIFQMAAPGDEDDDDVAVSAERAEAEFARVHTQAQPAVLRYEPADTVVLGSALFLQYEVDKQFFPVSAVWFRPVAIREHLFWYEAVLNSVFTTHFIGLVCHSAWLHSRYMARFRVSHLDRVLWLEVISLVLTVAAVSFGMFVTISELSGSLRVFVAVQLIANVACVLLVSPTVLFAQKRPRQRSRLVYASTCEQAVANALLAIALVVRLNSEWRSLTAAFAAFLVIGNAARSAYKAANLLAFRHSSARASPLFIVFAAVYIFGFLFVYSCVQLTISVFYVLFDSTALALLATVAACEIGTQFVDIYRESELIEKALGKVDPPAAINI